MQLPPGSAPATAPRQRPTPAATASAAPQLRLKAAVLNFQLLLSSFRGEWEQRETKERKQGKNVAAPAREMNVDAGGRPAAAGRGPWQPAAEWSGCADPAK